ncbi:ABC transporter substrate-binding protein [Halomonas sp. 86]|uniref:ABC transporter substrate-binding protein n=1 Tax=unclassified Halomonas TaxID=2609666 RepID=UPI00403346DB
MKHNAKSTTLILGSSLICLPVLAQEAPALGIDDDEYSLEALINAAQQEAPITVIDATGKIVTMAENFTEKYGIQATGVKMSAQEQEQVIMREAQANNVRTDVFNMSNLPSVTSQILPRGYAVSWFPPDLADVIPENYQSPAITSLNPWVWAYNSDVHTDGCPIDNIWALTEPEWNGRIAIPDPQLRSETMFWFNQLATNADDKIADAYEAYFGEPLNSNETSATAEWVKRLAKNNPTLTRSDSDVGPIVGAPNQDTPFIGFLSAAIFRHADRDGYGMAICEGMKPYVGQLTPRVAVIASGTDSPNAAKLFVRFMMTEEGMGPQLIDGKISTNTDAKMPEDERSGVFDLVEQLHVTDSTTSGDDFANLQDWQDIWIINNR